jgi:hypothetical protein
MQLLRMEGKRRGWLVTQMAVPTLAMARPTPALLYPAQQRRSTSRDPRVEAVSHPPSRLCVNGKVKRRQ